jgi:hypothetical protein
MRWACELRGFSILEAGNKIWFLDLAPWARLTRPWSAYTLRAVIAFSGAVRIEHQPCCARGLIAGIYR